jgi:hypothetical protein
LRVSVFSDRFRITLPIRTKNPLNNSQGVSRGAMLGDAARRRKQRKITRMTLEAYLRNWPSKGPWTITLTRIAPSSGLDDDSIGPAMKSIRDGITDALGKTNDRDPIFRWRYQQARGRRGEYAVEVKIDERK